MREHALTTELMTSILRDLALKICELSLEITTRDLCQAFTDIQGHTNCFDAVVRPIDAEIPEDDTPRPELAALRLQFYHYDFFDFAQKEEFFREQEARAHQYIEYLNLLLAKGKPVTVSDLQAAA
jgi:hypothetical protein